LTRGTEVDVASEDGRVLRDFEQTRSFRVESRRFDVLKEKRGNPFPKTLQVPLFNASHEKIRFSIDELDDVLRKSAVVLLDRVFEGEKNVQTLVLRQVFHVDRIVDVLQLSSADRVRCVHQRWLAVWSPPLLGVSRLVEELFDK